MTEKHKLKPTINKSFGYEGILQFLFNLLDYSLASRGHFCGLDLRTASRSHTVHHRQHIKA